MASEQTFDVVIHSHAVEDMRRAYKFVFKNAPNTVTKWFDRLQSHIQTLSYQPQRCPIARESKRVSIEVRELHFGRRPNVFRILFTIDEATVRILKIVRAQRRSPTWRSIESSFWSE